MFNARNSRSSISLSNLGARAVSQLPEISATSPCELKPLGHRVWREQAARDICSCRNLLALVNSVSGSTAPKLAFRCPRQSSRENCRRKIGGRRGTGSQRSLDPRFASSACEFLSVASDRTMHRDRALAWVIAPTAQAVGSLADAQRQGQSHGLALSV